jgi:hypothetical protein
MPIQREGNSGREEYSGFCTTDEGQPLEGCALMIGKEEVFSGPDGAFTLRSKKGGRRPLEVLIADFVTASLSWEVVSAPAVIEPRNEIATKDASVLIVVRRKTQ